LVVAFATELYEERLSSPDNSTATIIILARLIPGFFNILEMKRPYDISIAVHFRKLLKFC
jgi:hypothetical protein